MSSEGAYIRDKNSKLGGSWDSKLLKDLGYKKGMILRIKMVNFLTYDECEVFPGPKLNVILGPNGTGKSTVMHAVCLACAGKTDTIGRSNKTSQFIKHGKDGPNDETYIEIDLLGKNIGDGVGKTVRVKRTLKSIGSTNAWEIDGKKKAESDVKKLMASMNVDVDNLCTFMAQDKVGDFTMQSNQGMLQKTLQCIQALDEDEEPMGKTLYEVQCELNDIELTKKAKAREVEAKRQAYENVTMQLEIMRGEVDRMERRDQHKKLKDKYEIKLTMVRSEVVKRDLVALQDAVNDAQKELKNAQDKILPLEQRERELSHELQLKQKEYSKATKTIAGIETELDKDNRETRDAMTKLVDISGDLDSIITSRKENEKQLREKQDLLRQSIGIIKKTEPEIPTLKEEVRSIDEKRKKLVADKDILDEQVEDLKREKYALSKIRDKQEQSSSPWTLYYENLARLKEMRDEANCMQWVKKYEDRFEKPVIGPIGLYIKVEDKWAQLLVNKSINKNSMNSFIVQTEKDLETFRNIPSFNRKNQRNQAHVTLISKVDLEDWNKIGPAYSDSALKSFRQQFGFKGFLKDYIECDDLIKCYLATNFRRAMETIYARASSKNVVTEHHMRAICPGKGIGPKQADMFLVVDKSGTCDTFQFQLSYSTYNERQGLSSSSSMVSFSENFLRYVSAADMENEENKVSDVQWNDCLRKISDASKKGSVIRKEISDLSQKRDAIKKKIDSFATAQRRSKILTANINQLRNALSGGEKEERAKLEGLYLKTTKYALDKLDIIYERSRTAVDLHSKFAIEQEAQQIFADELKRACDALDDAKQGLEEFKTKVKAAVQAQSKKKVEVDEAMKEVKLIQSTFASREEFLKYYGDEVLPSCPEVTVVDIEIRIEELERAIMNIADNTSILEKYEAKKAEEEKLREALQELESELSDSDAIVRDQSRSWIQQVTRIINRVNTKFSEFMKALEFTGEVKFSERGSFLQYELQLHVAFKDNQSVQLLDGHKHSGGERAVSTIMYLMALQNLISSPFRSVDEINQGMDERNERLVFDRIVSSCTGASVHSQYFLVSPKLLQGLRSMDHSDVTVLMVWNGPGVRSRWQISQIISNMKKRKRSSLSEITNRNEFSQESSADDEVDEDMPSRTRII